MAEMQPAGGGRGEAGDQVVQKGFRTGSGRFKVQKHEPTSD
jgi:hypothetical protein